MAELESMDLRAAVKRDVEATLLMLPLWEKWRNDRHDFRRQVHLAFEVTDARPIEYALVSDFGAYLLPGGWFDWNAAAFLRATMECRRIAISPGPVSAWTEGAADLRSAHYPDVTKKNHLLIAFPHATWPLTVGANAMVLLDLMVAACLIERSCLKDKAYPELLPPDIPEDPRFSRPFAYFLKPGGGFEVYSVGANGTDDSARSKSKRRQKDDIWW
ncbi:hypothetical protein [Luteolibacter rhizosphaerae]|uniref:hypothetical protein n=1 Tax=Luteolibacter rhizosphaerae TaxID=2989719 RepID=UPI0022216EC4|nr:hypothetical protein [Luteolibacter rhizosphaerae]